MFHIIYKIAKSIVLPFLFIIIEAEIKRRKHQEIRLIDLCCKWLAFWAIGVGGMSAGLMQALNPAYTASLLNVQTGDMIVIRELGYAQTGIGLIGLLSVWLSGFRKPAAVSFGVFILGATVIHLTRLGHIGIDEIASLADDIWTVGVAVLILVHKEQRYETSTE